MDTIHDVIAAVPRSAQLALAGLGALWVGSKALNLLRLVLSMLVLSGTNVSLHRDTARDHHHFYTEPGTDSMRTPAAPKIRRQRYVGRRYRCVRWPRQRVCDPACCQGLQSPSRISNAVQARSLPE